MRFNRILALLLVSAAGAAGAGDINYAYRVGGAKDVVPLQVFDDGQNLYLQFSPGRIAAPPVPFGENGKPVEYEMRAPYMVLPIVPRLILRVGSAKALVESADDQGGFRSSGGVRGKNVWYGGAIPSTVTSSAERPVSAEALAAKARSQVEPKVATATQRAPASVSERTKEPVQQRKGSEAEQPQRDLRVTEDTVVPAPAKAADEGVKKGRFVVYPQEDSLGAGEKTWLVVSVSRQLSTSEIERLLRFSKPVIEADGTSAGYAKASSIKTLLGSKRPVVRPRGAESGFVRISDGGAPAS